MRDEVPADRHGRVVRWLRGRDLRMVAGLGALAALVWGFLEIADQVRDATTAPYPGQVGLDDRILLAFRAAGRPEQGVGPPWLEDVVRDLSALGGVTIVTIVTFAVVGYLLLARQRRTAVFVIVAVTGGALFGTLLKSLFGRARPTIVPHLAHVSSLSFPSGHSMLSAILYPTLGALIVSVVKRRRIKAYVMGLALSLALLVGVSRVYLGVHYPTDVLAGWTVGFAWALSCGLAARALQRRGAIERPGKTAVARPA